jgi:hypothetical protein
VLKTRAVPIRILEIDRYSKALSGPANNQGLKPISSWTAKADVIAVGDAVVTAIMRAARYQCS